MEKTVYKVQVIGPSESKNLDKLGVVEIYPNSKILQHCLDPSGPPGWPGTSWTDLQAFEFKEKNLETVIKKHIEGANTALIIVHMQVLDDSLARANGYYNKYKKILKTQAAALKEASLKEIPIYATFRIRARARADAEEGTLPKLPKTLQKQILMFSSENCFYNEARGQRTVATGNALWAENENNETLKDELRKNWIKRAIVFGQALGLCVDNTIFGRFGPPYENGLLDLGIAVVTARNVLGPDDAHASPYFNFKLTPNRIEPDIELNLNALPQPYRRAQAD